MKIKKKLIIINLSKNYKYEINESNCDCINISSGQIDVGKSNISGNYLLHFQIWKNEEKLNPETWLKK